MDRPILSSIRKPTSIEQELERIQSRNMINIEDSKPNLFTFPTLDSASANTALSNASTIDSTQVSRRSLSTHALSFPSTNNTNSNLSTTSSNFAIVGTNTHKSSDSIDHSHSIQPPKGLKFSNDNFSSKLLQDKKKVDLNLNENIKMEEETVDVKPLISTLSSVIPPNKPIILFSTPVSFLNLYNQNLLFLFSTYNKKF